MIDSRKPDFADTPVAATRSVLNYAAKEDGGSPYVTIITPFYNTGPVFHETARSLLQQSFQQWEWLIINDVSTDETALAVLADYRESDPRIRVIDLPTNLGPGGARNAGYREAQAEYIVQLDSDDLLEPTAIEKWLWFLESHPEYAFVKGYVVGFDAEEYLWEQGFHTAKLFLTANQINSTCMVRKAVHTAVGGFDETIRGGFEDWDFWLRCANAGYWGGTVPEYLDWYRRRPSHGDRWATWDSGKHQQAFHRALQQKYADLWQRGMPDIPHRHQTPYENITDSLPFRNKLARSRPRVLLLLPWLTMGGADKFNLDLLKLLVEQHGYEVTIATTLEGRNEWAPLFAKYTSDIFLLSHYLRLADYPRCIHYLIESRQIDTVLISNSYLGYQLLPYLRAHCPNVVFMDYIHMEEEHWKNGGYPQASLNHAEELDLTVVSSEHLKGWMVKRGGDPTRIKACTTNIDSAVWDPSRYDRAALRAELGIAADESVMLYAGRICAQKQPQLFAQVMLRLSQQHAHFVCLVAGDGEDEPWLTDFVRRHHLQSVRMLGSVSNQRIAELLALSDIFFLPSQMEGISLAIYEAMAMGVVPVSADVGGQRELVAADCGFLIRRGPTEEDSYVDVLTTLLQKPHLRAEMGVAARQRICTLFRIEQMGKRMVSLMECAHQLAEAAPRPAIPVGLGRETAIQVIEHTRVERLAEQLWLEREMLLNNRPTRDQFGRYIVLKTVRGVKNMLRPVYRWSVAHGLDWLVPLRDQARMLLLRRVR